MKAATVGKKELAEALGWSRPHLDKRLKTDPKFPVAKVGDQSGGWQFDLVKVKAYLAGKPAVTAAVDKAQLRDIVAPAPAPPLGRPSAQHVGEATARQRKDSADAGLKEIKLQLQLDQLVFRSEVRGLLSELCAGLGNDLDALPEDVVKRLELPDSAVPVLRKLIDDIRTAMVKRAEPLFGDG